MGKPWGMFVTTTRSGSASFPWTCQKTRTVQQYYLCHIVYFTTTLQTSLVKCPGLYCGRSTVGASWLPFERSSPNIYCLVAWSPGTPLEGSRAHPRAILAQVCEKSDAEPFSPHPPTPGEKLRMGEGSGGKFAHDALELSVQFSLGLYSNWGVMAPDV